MRRSGLQADQHLFDARVQMPGQIPQFGGPAGLGCELADCPVDAQRRLLRPARHVDRPAGVAEVAFELAEDRRDREGAKRDSERRVETANRPEQAEARDLDEIVDRLVGIAIAVGEPTRKREEASHEFLPHGGIVSTGPEFVGWTVAQPVRIDET